MAVSYGIAPARATSDGHWVLKDDVIRLISFSSAARNIALAGSIVDPIGGRELEAPSGNQTTNSDRTSATTNYTVLNNGSLAACTVVLQSGESGGKRGECFVRVVLLRNNVIIAQVLADYIEANYNPPMGVHKSSVEGEGLPRSIDLGNPAAGAEYAAQTVSTNASWTLRGSHGQLVTDGTAANRNPSVRIRDESDVTVGGGAASVSHVASRTVDYLGEPGALPFTAANPPNPGAANIGLPKTRIPEGFDVFFVTTDIVAGDNWGDGQLLIMEWIDP